MLSQAEVAAHHDAGSGAPVNQRPTAAFTSSTDGLKASFDGSGSSDPEGAVTYAWTFGDGETSSVAKPEHVYGAAGDYSVSLTVTDAGGLTDKVTKSVTVAPVNQRPTAAFTSSTDGLKASFDGSGSSDPEGAVTYAWTFGDGETSSAAKPEHVYGGAGDYSVSLTVTDAGGLTDKVTKSVTVTAPAGPALVAADDFARTVTNGWGAADQGGSWTLTSSKANFKVGGGTGSMTMSSPGSGPTASLAGLSSSDSDVQVQLSPDKLTTGGGLYATVVGRSVSGAGAYRSQLIFRADGKVSLGISRLDANGAQTVLNAQTLVPGLTYTAGDVVNLRVQVTGTSPTTVRSRAWKVGQAEPTAWAESITDSTAGLQAKGSVTLQGYLSGSSTNAPVVLGFDALRIYDLGQ